MTVHIKITDADREWLRKAADILSGHDDASETVRKTAARNLLRLEYRADLASR
jgi:hypothetical protein